MSYTAEQVTKLREKATAALIARGVTRPAPDQIVLEMRKTTLDDAPTSEADVMAKLKEMLGDANPFDGFTGKN